MVRRTSGAVLIPFYVISRGPLILLLGLCTVKVYSEGFGVPLSGPTPQRLPTFNDAPIDFLSTHLTGRERGLEHIQQVFDVTHGNIPTRCSIRGMHGLGKNTIDSPVRKSII
jgi:hypothetical protein